MGPRPLRGGIIAAGLVEVVRRGRGRPSAASRAPASSSSRVAPSTASGEPKCEQRSLARRARSRQLVHDRLGHRLVAPDPVVVIANRCASSRTRWSSCSSGVSCGSTSGSRPPGGTPPRSAWRARRPRRRGRGSPGAPRGRPRAGPGRRRSRSGSAARRTTRRARGRRASARAASRTARSRRRAPRSSRRNRRCLDGRGS